MTKATPCKAHKKTTLGAPIHCVSSYYLVCNVYTPQHCNWRQADNIVVLHYQWADSLICQICCAHWDFVVCIFTSKVMHCSLIDNSKKKKETASCSMLWKSEHSGLAGELSIRIGIASAPINLELFNFTSGIQLLPPVIIQVDYCDSISCSAWDFTTKWLLEQGVCVAGGKVWMLMLLRSTQAALKSAASGFVL